MDNIPGYLAMLNHGAGATHEVLPCDTNGACEVHSNNLLPVYRVNKQLQKLALPLDPTCTIGSMSCVADTGISDNHNTSDYSKYEEFVRLKRGEASDRQPIVIQPIKLENQSDPQPGVLDGKYTDHSNIPETITVAIKKEEGEDTKQETLIHVVNSKSDNGQYENNLESTNDGVPLTTTWLVRDDTNDSQEIIGSSMTIISNYKHSKELNVPQKNRKTKQRKSPKKTINKDERQADKLLFETARKDKRCPICKIKFTYSNTIDNHMRFHTKQNRFDCTICGKYYDKACLKKHLRMHFEDNHYPCCACGETFKALQTLKTHFRQHEPEKYVQMMCEHCGTEGDALVMKKHQCAGNRKMEHCEKCGKIFYKSARLQHLCRIDKRPFVCELCGKGFSRVTKLKYHMDEHMGEKTRICHICSEGFFTPDDLHNHYKKSHPGAKRHQCEICKSQFSTRVKLQKHSKTHNQNRPFSCDLCQTRFLTKKLLADHIGKMHTEKS